MPWIHPSFFDLQNKTGTLFEAIEYYDKQLLDYFFNEYSDWESYCTACMNLLEGLLKLAIKIFLEQDYIKETGNWTIEKQGPQDFNYNSPLVARYASLEPIEEQSAPVRVDLRALRQAIDLKPGDIQACQLPMGAPKIEFIKILLTAWYACVINY